MKTIRLRCPPRRRALEASDLATAKRCRLRDLPNPISKLHQFSCLRFRSRASNGSSGRGGFNFETRRDLRFQLSALCPRFGMFASSYIRVFSFAWYIRSWVFTVCIREHTYARSFGQGVASAGFPFRYARYSYHRDSEKARKGLDKFTSFDTTRRTDTQREKQPIGKGQASPSLLCSSLSLSSSARWSGKLSARAALKTTSCPFTCNATAELLCSDLV